MFEVIDARLDDRPFRLRLDALSAELGASRWVLLWREGGTWQRLGTPGTRDALLAAVAERRPGRLDRVPTDGLEPGGPRLRSAGLGTVSALTLDPDRPAVAFFEEPTNGFGDRVEPARWFGAALETAVATAGAVDLAAWVPDVTALAAGELSPEDALRRLARSFGLTGVVVVRPSARGVSVHAVSATSGSAPDVTETSADIEWSTIAADPEHAMRWLPAGRAAPRWASAVVSNDGVLVLGAEGSGPRCEHLASVAGLLARGLDHGRSVEATREQIRMTERTRLATTLHEELSQQLATLTIEIDLLSSRPASSAVTDELAHLRRGVVDALESLRSAIFELTPPEPDWTRLEDGLERFVRDHAAVRGLEVDYLVKGEARPTGPEVVSLVFATVQEAISNVAKHAETSRARVRVEFAADHLVVAVSDRGVGLADDLDRTDRMHQGLGVVRTRARLAGAKLEVESEAGTGTTVRLAVPVSTPEEVVP